MTLQEQMQEYLGSLTPFHEKLSESHEKLLYFIIWNGGEATVFELEKFASYTRTGRTALNKLLKDLLKAGIIRENLFHNYACRYSDYFMLALTMLKFRRDLCPEFERIIKKRDKTRIWLWNIATAVFDGDSKVSDTIEIPEAGTPYDSISPSCYLWPVCRLRAFWPYIYRLDMADQYVMVRTYLDTCMENDSLAEERLDDLDEFLSENPGADADKVSGQNMSDMINLYRFIWTGKGKAGKNKTQTVWSLAHEAVQALYKRDMKTCTENFTASLKLKNKNSKDKNLYYESILSFLLIIAYKIADTEESRTKISQFLKKNSVKEIHSLWPAALAAEYLNKACNSRIVIFSLRDIAGIGNRQYQVYAMLLAKSFGIDAGEIWTDPENFVLPQCALLRYELSPYFRTDDQEELAGRFGGAPLLASIRLREQWEYLIDDLVSLYPDSAVSPGHDKRIVYLLTRHGNVDMLLQSKTKTGKWSAGRKLPEYDIRRLSGEYMDEYDRRIMNASAYSFSRSYKFMFPLLAGCDRVYYLQTNPENSVDIAEEKPYISVIRTADGIRIDSNAISDGNVCALTVKKTDRLHYTVIQLSERQMKLLGILKSIESFPPEAEQALRETLDRIKDIIIRSDLDGPESAVPRTDGQSTVIFQIIPHKGKFCTALTVRPLPDGQRTFLPGKGDRTYYDCTSEKVKRQVIRNLKAERDRYEEALYFLENEEAVEPDENGHCNLDIGQLLSLLEFVKESPGKFAIEWPEGKSLKFNGVLTSRQVSINVTSGEQWLEMEGNVNIDDERTVRLAQLLSGISSGVLSGRYVRLGEKEYVALSESLMSQMKRIEAISQPASSERTRISVFQTGLLAELLQKSGFSSVNTDRRMKELESSLDEAARMDIQVPAALNATLRDYQEEGFRWIVRLDHWGAGACLADDMGLGKTLQAIAFLLYKARSGPSLVVAPTSVLLNWKSEIEKFAPELDIKNINVASDKTAMIQSAGPSDVFLTSYRLLVSEKDLLDKTKWNVVCLDEAHAIKNRETATSDAVMSLQASSRLVLTGTPVQNYLGELWNLFQFLNPGLLGTYRQFSDKFINTAEYDSAMRRQQLKKIISPFLLRRTKADVIEELPGKTEITYRIPLSSRERLQYEVLRESARRQAESSNKVNVNVLAAITRLRQASCDIALVDKEWDAISSKTEAFLDLAAEILDGRNRILVFSQFTSYLSRIAYELDRRNVKYFYLDGTVPAEKRAEMVSSFQCGEKQVFLISLKAGGLGLNLTGANYVVHLDPWWNPAIEQQATDRAYRIGQTRNVTVYHFISENTIEDKILRLHKVKNALSDAVLEGQDTWHTVTIEELREMLGN